MEKKAKHPATEPIDELENLTIPTGTIPIKTLKLMIENETEREWVVNPSSDGKGIVLIESRSQVMFEMTNQDAMNIIIEQLEQNILYDK